MSQEEKMSSAGESQGQADKGSLSDGYHTFNELYEHRHALFAVACSFLGGWKSKLHDDGTMFDGWFIAGLTTSEGPATYHLPMRLWDRFPGRERERAPAWDGHTAGDVVERLWAHVAALVSPGVPAQGEGFLFQSIQCTLEEFYQRRIRTRGAERDYLDREFIGRIQRIHAPFLRDLAGGGVPEKAKEGSGPSPKTAQEAKRLTELLEAVEQICQLVKDAPPFREMLYVEGWEGASVAIEQRVNDMRCGLLAGLQSGLPLPPESSEEGSSSQSTPVQSGEEAKP